MKQHAPRFLLFCSLLSLGSACSEEPTEWAPNVIFISVDSLRADHTSMLGYGRQTTPCLERFAEDAVVYTQAQAQASWTRPSYSSMLTGRWNSDLAALHHLEGRSLSGALADVYDNPFGIPKEAATLAGMLQDSGYGFATVGRAQNHNLSLDLNFGSGFDSFDPQSGLRASKIVERALDEIERLDSGKRPFFLFVHFEQAHYPFPSSPPYAGLWSQGQERKLELSYINKLMSRRRLVMERKGTPLFEVSAEEDAYLRAQLPLLYDRSIAEVDAGIGQLLDELRERGLYEDSLIVFNADHGEEFGEHGHWGHGHTLKQELLHIPLAIKFPSRAGIAPTRIDQPVSNLDLLPTILAAVGIESEADWIHGRDLNPRQMSREHPYPISEGGPDGGLQKPGMLAMRGPRYKLIYHFEGPASDSRQELAYDLLQDPSEQRPLDGGQMSTSEEVAELRRRMDAWLLVHRKPLGMSELEAMDPELNLSEETLRGLDALGYTGEE